MKDTQQEYYSHFITKSNEHKLKRSGLQIGNKMYTESPYAVQFTYASGGETRRGGSDWCILTLIHGVDRSIMPQALTFIKSMSCNNDFKIFMNVTKNS